MGGAKPFTPPDRGRLEVAPDVWRAQNWRAVESLFRRDGEKWTLQELRIAWKRCVHAHLGGNTQRLHETAACSNRNGRQFLKDLMNATLFKLEKNDWRMSGKQARDIGWSAGKQWFMDERLVDAVQVGILHGVNNKEIELFEAVPVAWAIANSGQYPVRLFELFKERAGSIPDIFNLQHCTNCLWAMAVCGYHPGHRFLEMIANVACSFLDSDESTIIPQAVADLLWSLGRLNLHSGHEKLVLTATSWAYTHLPIFTPEEMLTMTMGLAMLESLGLEDMRTIAAAFHAATRKTILDAYIDQFVALTLLFPREDRTELHEIAFGSGPAVPILAAHQDRQAQIAVQMQSNKFLRLIARQLDKVAEGKYEIGTLTDDRNLALEVLVHGENEDYSVIPVYPMSRCRNDPEIELGEVRIAQKLVEAQGIKFGGFLEWITPEDNETSDSDTDDSETEHKQTDVP